MCVCVHAASCLSPVPLRPFSWLSVAFAPRACIVHQFNFGSKHPGSPFTVQSGTQTGVTHTHIATKPPKLWTFTVHPEWGGGVGGDPFQRINDFPILTRFSFGIQDGLQRDINLRKSLEKLGHLWATHFMPAKQMCDLKANVKWREMNIFYYYLHFAILTAGIGSGTPPTTLLGKNSG